MARVSIYFRNEQKGFELINLSYDPDVYAESAEREIIKIACSFQIFGNTFFEKGIERFVSNKWIQEFRFLISSERKCYYVIRREED